MTSKGSLIYWQVVVESSVNAASTMEDVEVCINKYTCSHMYIR